jgi:hypothetical protein
MRTYMALLYIIFSVFLTTITTIFTTTYQENTGIAGLNYLALGIGITCVSQVNSRLMDTIYVYLRSKRGGQGEPEYRVRES